ncbi:MAG: monodechloroaminopyrrolnitrin synthase PrnB family protein [Pseudomonadota bacterium]
MSAAAEAFDHWIRGAFIEMNTALEEVYFALDDPGDVIGAGEDIKGPLVEEGRALIAPLVAEGNTEQRFDIAFDVLGNLGLFLGALRRHELTNPDNETRSPFEDCSALGMHIAASLGVAPRFATAHLTTHNRAVGGAPKSFTALADEKLFIDHNTFAILSYKKAGDALMRIPPMGVSSAATPVLLDDAKQALESVARFNKQLFDDLDVRRFFYCVRPYYKPYRVGDYVYRGANAGDFAEINQIDLLLGLCRGNDPYYAQVLEEKILFMMPDDQQGVRNCLKMRPLLDEFLDAAEEFSTAPWFKENARAFIDVCVAHGRTAQQHHNMLFSKFIRTPAETLDARHLEQITASGPALDALSEALERLRDLRIAAPRSDIETAHEALSRLKRLADWRDQ